MNTDMYTRPSLRVSAALVSALILLLAGIAAVSHVSRASALTNCTVADNTIDAEEQAFLTLINNYRSQNGLASLSLSTNLSRAATWHGTDMGQKKYFSHTDSLGRSPSKRVVDCGYPSGAGENIAAGTVWDTAAEAFTAWKNSSGHNANMLNSYYRQIGIARVYVAGSPYSYYWVTDFGATNDGTGGTAGGSSTPTPTGAAAQAPSAPTPTPTATPTQVAPTSKAAMTSPVPGAVLPGTRATFQWTAGSGALEYRLYVGTSRGSSNIVSKSTGTSRSLVVSNLPNRGQRVYVRLWTRFSGGWQYTDYTYTAYRR